MSIREFAQLFCCVGCANGEDEITKALYVLITVGLKVHFTLVSIVEEEVNYATQSATIFGNQIEVDTIYSISREQLVNPINELLLSSISVG